MGNPIQSVAGTARQAKEADKIFFVVGLGAFQSSAAQISIASVAIPRNDARAAAGAAARCTSGPDGIDAAGLGFSAGTSVAFALCAILTL